MIKSRQPVRVFWQIVLAGLGVAFVGVVLLVVCGKPHAQANSLVPRTNMLGTGNFPALLPPLEHRMNILLLGVDSNGANTSRFVGTRSDTMVLMSLDPISKKVGVVSIPRDSRVTIANGHGLDKINAAHAYGGPELAMATVRENFQVPVDHYVVIDTEGLRKLFEALGPVEVLVEKDMHYHDHSGHLNIDLKPGLQSLNPEQAEDYVRFRHDMKGDIGRVERQQWFLRQIAGKLKDPQVLLKLPAIMQFAQQYVITDLSVDDMARALSFLKDYDFHQVKTAMLPGEPAMINGGSYWIVDQPGAKVIFDRLVNSSEQSPNAVLSAGVPSNSNAISIAIKYPKGSDGIAGQYEAILKNAGFQVKYKWLSDISECQHEQIVQNSTFANDQNTQLICKSLPAAANWPVVVAVDSHPVVDFTLVVSPRIASAALLSTK